MKDDGSIVDIENPEAGGPYAGDMIRYSPRRVDIPAGGSQTIRLAARRPKDLPNGEYLSHLVLKQIPNKTIPSDTDNNTDDSNKQLNLAVQPVLKIAIPVIVRKGTSNTIAEISDILPITKEGLVEEVHFTLHRQGEFSLSGNVELFELNEEEPGPRVGFIRGIALYATSLKRLVRIRFNEAIKSSGKTYLLRFSDDEKYGGSSIVEKKISF